MDRPLLVRLCAKSLNDIKTAHDNVEKYRAALDEALIDAQQPGEPLSTFFVETSAQIEQALVAYFAHSTHDSAPRKVRYLLIDPVLLLRFRVPFSPTPGERCHPAIRDWHFDVDLSCPDLRHCFVMGTCDARSAGMAKAQIDASSGFEGLVARSLSGKEFRRMAKRILTGPIGAYEGIPSWAKQLTSEQERRIFVR